MADLAYFRTAYPEFDDPVASDVTVQYYLDLAETHVVEAKWGKWYDEGHAAYAAHLLELSLRRQKSGGGNQSSSNVSSKRADGLAVSYAVGQSSGTSETWYLSTPYGARYWQLLQLVGIPAALAVSPLAEV
jgi:hypothetical protein